FEWQELGANAGLRVPLTLTRSKYITQLQVGNYAGITDVTAFTHEVIRNDGTVVAQGTSNVVSVNDSLNYIYRQLTGNGTLLYNHAFATFSHNLKQSRRDFNPRFGQSIR